MVKLGVYGTLRKGMNNHRLLRDSKHVDTVRVPGWMMITLGSYIPTIVYTGTAHDSVVLEVYEVDEDTLHDIDQLEGYAGPNGNNWYTRSLVYGDEVYAYTWQHIVKGGDYVEWRSRRG
jgi:gamma-glutamylcyclotransferase (GGCT)/AIG2-like uncharacterized protein YtfP